MTMASVSSGTDVEFSLATRGTPPGARRRISGIDRRRRTTASNDQVSWLAPPDEAASCAVDRVHECRGMRLRANDARSRRWQAKKRLDAAAIRDDPVGDYPVRR